jgi:hypothetical protein
LNQVLHIFVSTLLKIDFALLLASSLWEGSCHLPEQDASRTPKGRDELSASQSPAPSAKTETLM